MNSAIKDKKATLRLYDHDLEGFTRIATLTFKDNEDVVRYLENNTELVNGLYESSISASRFIVHSHFGERIVTVWSDRTNDGWYDFEKIPDAIKDFVIIIESYVEPLGSEGGRGQWVIQNPEMFGIDEEMCVMGGHLAIEAIEEALEEYAFTYGTFLRATQGKRAKYFRYREAGVGNPYKHIFYEEGIDHPNFLMRGVMPIEHVYAVPVEYPEFPTVNGGEWKYITVWQMDFIDHIAELSNQLGLEVRCREGFWYLAEH